MKGSRIPDWLVFFAGQLARSKRSFLLVALQTDAASVCGAAAPLLIGRLMDAITTDAGQGMGEIAVLLLAVLLAFELCVAFRAYVSARTMIRLSYN